MKLYTNEVTIKAPRDKVVELFDSQDNLAKWQPGFISLSHISGEPGQVGAKSALKYKMGKREIEMVETITAKNLPELFSGTYEENTTKYWTENEFKMRGFMKLMAFLMPGAFKKQSQKYLDLFKDFVEKEVGAN